MTRNLTSIDPYTPSTGYYECVSCPYRESAGDRVDVCPQCGEKVRNIAVPRE